jgi:hypothetical protein
MKPLIILTVTDKLEKGIYIKAIKEWLRNTSYPLVVVENTGYTFPELEMEKEILKDRFEIISYVETEIGGNNVAREMFSIRWAYSHTQFSSAHFIIKITGLYYFSGLKPFLEGLNLDDYDVLIQKDRYEMVGCHKRNFERVFGVVGVNVEDVYQNERIIRLPEFPIGRIR